MRLGQLARKLSLRPGQIIEFLAKNNIQVEENSNLRLEDSQVEMIVGHFAPESLAEIKAEPDEVEETVAVAIEPVVQLEESELISSPSHEEIEPSADSLPEVIRVQKVELSGLKVLGKIELPEPKKKEPVEQSEDETSTVEKPALNKISDRADKRKPKHDRRDRSQQRDRKNPVQLQREREAREEEEKKRLAIEREKEKRKRHYEEKRKSVVQPKRVKPAKQQPTIAKRTDTRPVPKTWFGKFLRWWTT